MTARVPFALVGVLLLVGSASFAGSLQAPTVSGPSVDDALDRTAAETQSALREAVRTAADEAARNPVTSRAGTPEGRVLNRTTPFRDSLRLRAYLAARDRLGRLDGRRDGLDVTATLPAASTPRELRDAKNRVAISRVGPDGAAIRATIENVALTARRDGSPVGRRDISPTVTVPVPTLLVHDRVSAFEHRLDAGPDEPGLGGRLTARLYALGWVRGYAQFRGAPIENVIANRHLGVLTNGAILSMQRAHFGHSDETGRSVLGWATAHTAFTDAIDGSDNAVAEALSTASDDGDFDRLPGAALEEVQADTRGASSGDTTTVEINQTADGVFLDAVDGLDADLRKAYAVDVERRTATERRGRTVETGNRPPSNWSLADVETSRRTVVRNRSAPTPETDGKWHVLAHYPRMVTNVTTLTRTWRTPDGTRTTVEHRKIRYAVDVTLVGRHDGGPAPVRPFETVHRRGGPLDGPNLADVREKARRALLTDSGGVDAVAGRAPSAASETVSGRVLGDRPPGLGDWAYRDLAGLRQRVRNISVTVPKGELATLQVNPFRRLSERLEDRRGELLDAPETYDGVADRARVSARVAYLDAVDRALELRALGHESRRGKLREQLGESDAESLDGFQSDYENRNPEKPPSTPGGVQMRVEASPSYLTLSGLEGDEIAAIQEGETEHPLAVRNLNLFTLPYGDAADAIAEALFGPERTRLRTAAQTLQAARRDGLDAGKLRSNVEESTAFLRQVAAAKLATETSATEASGRKVTRRALSRWETPEARALAMTNGSGARAIRDAAAERLNLSDRASDELGIRLRLTLARHRSTEFARPPQPPVERTGNNVRLLAEERVSKRISDTSRTVLESGVEAKTGRAVSQLPAGLPLAPVPGLWYLTVNYWEVQVRGEYARFAVSVPRGTPEDPGGRLRYVRDGGPVTLDVDGDGDAERIGRSTRVSFRTHTSVAVAVPAGKTGVGDVDGQMDERSPGWPDPGR